MVTRLLCECIQQPSQVVYSVSYSIHGISSPISRCNVRICNNYTYLISFIGYVTDSSDCKLPYTKLYDQFQVYASSRLYSGMNFTQDTVDICLTRYTLWVSNGRKSKYTTIQYLPYLLH